MFKVINLNLYNHFITTILFQKSHQEPKIDTIFLSAHKKITWLNNSWSNNESFIKFNFQSISSWIHIFKNFFINHTQCWNKILNHLKNKIFSPKKCFFKKTHACLKIEGADVVIKEILTRERPTALLKRTTESEEEKEKKRKPRKRTARRYASFPR